MPFIGSNERGKPPGQGSFAARFGRAILQHGVAAIPSALFHFQGRLGLTAQQVWFVSYILAHKWTDTLPHPSLNKMAECTGVDRRVLQYRCAELANLGMLQIEPRYGERGDQSTNYFDFSGLFERLEAILLDEPGIPNPIRDTEGREPLKKDSGAAIATRLTSPPSPTDPLDAAAVGPGEQLDYSFLARYGRVLLRYGIATVPKAIFTHQAALCLTPQQVWFVCYVLSFQWDASLPYPSINKMAERTGYSKRQLLRIKDDLVSRRYLEIVRRTSSDRGNDTNAYDFSLLFEAIRKELQAPEEAGDDTRGTHDIEPAMANSDTPAQAASDPLEDVRAEPTRRSGTRAAQPRGRSATVSSRPSPVAQAKSGHGGVEQSDTRGAERDVPRGIDQHDTRGVVRPVTGPLEQDVTWPLEQHVTTAATYAPRAAQQRRSPGGRKPESPELEARKLERNHEDDSNRLSPKKQPVENRKSGYMARYSPYIAAVASDFSMELGDTAHEASNIKQALNLWTSSGLVEQQFIELMQEARKLTRKYQSRPTRDVMSNKMAYFFATLKDLLERGHED